MTIKSEDNLEEVSTFPLSLCPRLKGEGRSNHRAVINVFIMIISGFICDELSKRYCGEKRTTHSFSSVPIEIIGKTSVRVNSRLCVYLHGLYRTSQQL